MKILKQNIGRWSLIGSVVTILILVVTRVQAESFMANVMGFNDPGKYLDRTLYVLTATSFVLAYKLCRRMSSKIIMLLHPDAERLGKMEVSLDGIGSRISDMTLDMGNITSSMSKFNTRLDASDLLASREFRKINSSLVDINIKLGGIENTKELKDKCREKMQLIRNAKLVFINKLSSDLYRFAVYKTNVFIGFVLDIHEQGFYCADEDGARIDNSRLNYHALQDNVLCNELKVRDAGYDMLNKEYIEFYYTKHMEEVELYISYIRKILKDPDNFKHERFQERSELFMCKFLEMMHHTWLDFKEDEHA